MSTIITTERVAFPESSMPTWEPAIDSIYRLSVGQYEAMVASGVFTKRDRLHLIKGVLVSKMAENLHLMPWLPLMLWETMVPLVPGGWHLRLDKPLRIPLRHKRPGA